MKHLERRAIEARPELSDPDSDLESEPDMHWIKNGAGDPMQLDRKSPNVAISYPPSKRTDDLHNIPSPRGSMSSRGSTPIPPTPPSPSIASDSGIIDNYKLGENGHHKPQTYSPTSAALDHNPPPERPSPAAFTPVQKEDSLIFQPKSFEFLTQRMEQDRERQRRKEDKSGFTKGTGNVDEEIEAITQTGREYVGDVFAAMEAEEKTWQTAAKYE
jgi:hypothetical protein